MDRALKQFVFETMNLADVSAGSKRNQVRLTSVNEAANQIIPWDDPYPNISETLSEEQQLLLKTLNTLEAKRDMERQQLQRATSASSSTNKSIKFQDELASDSKGVDNLPSGILKSRSSTKLSGKCQHF